GFITFRMKELREDLEEIVDKVVERYMTEKEYNEFIKLLKYFVEIQESKIEEINIIIKSDGKYLIQDKEGNDIEKNYLLI
ncbi:sporulation protein YtxC, partial [Clostridium carboxidivorans P7]